jgi:hypothetical protein
MKKLRLRRPLRLNIETVKVLDRQQMTTVVGGTNKNCEPPDGSNGCKTGGCETWQ